MTTTCELCGVEYGIGCSPWCKDGHQPVGLAVHPDDWPGGKVFENGFDQPMRFYSKSEHERALAARGLEIRAKHAGPHDKIMSNWAAGISAKQLDDARVLLERGAQARAERQAQFAASKAMFPIAVTTVEGPQ